MNSLLKGILYPFSVLYNGVTAFRNLSFDKGWKKSFRFDIPVISVGNLTVGGTGKTPHVEYLVRLLKSDYNVGVLSRGYGRKTNGYILAEEGKVTAREIGDEPMQYFTKYGKDVLVAVGEERALAIPNMLLDKEELDVILLDDAYQHRKVKRTVDILLTDYGRLFYKDLVLPSGRLRESRKGAERASMVVVTKCPNDISDAERKEINTNISKYTRKECPVFFTYIKYGAFMPVLNPSLQIEGRKDILLVTGIANTERLKADIHQMGYNVLSHLEFSDHVKYNKAHIKKIVESYQGLMEKNVIVLTTEKDAVKLSSPELKGSLDNMPLFCLPIEIDFVENRKDFDSSIKNHIK